MRYLRPFDLSPAGPGAEWLVTAEEGLGCAIRLRRGTGETDAGADMAADRFVYVLGGSVALSTGGVAGAGDLIFLPAGGDAAATGGEGSLWVEARAFLADGAAPKAGLAARIITVDPAKFEGHGFAYQSLIDRSDGSQAMRMNVLQVQPGSGSPDWHIHAFTQMYIITEGAMTVDIGCSRHVAGPGTLVVFPAGVVHRNFNAGATVERHVTFLVPEPAEGAIFDYAITIHDEEAEIMTAIPA